VEIGDGREQGTDEAMVCGERTKRKKAGMGVASENMCREDDDTEEGLREGLRVVFM
jgi:hypothetical protein